MKVQAPVYRNGHIIKSDWTVHQDEINHLKKIISGLQNELVAQNELKNEITHLKRQVKDLTWEKQNLAKEVSKYKPPPMSVQLKAFNELQEEWEKDDDGVWRKKKVMGRPKKKPA